MVQPREWAQLFLKVWLEEKLVKYLTFNDFRHFRPEFEAFTKRPIFQLIQYTVSSSSLFQTCILYTYLTFSSLFPSLFTFRLFSLYAAYRIRAAAAVKCLTSLDTVWRKGHNTNNLALYTVYIRKHTNILFVKRKI